MSDATRLPVKTKLGFGIGDLGGNLFFTFMSFYSLYFLTDTLLVPSAVAGLVIAIGKIWDAITDPVMGYISDRTRSRWGRRRVWMLLGAPLLFASFWWFLSAPSIGDPTAVAVWAALVLCLLNTAYTMVNIPYNSLTPDLTKDYREQSSLNGYRFTFAVVGTILGAGVVPFLRGRYADGRGDYTLVGVVFGAIMLLTTVVTVLAVRERDNRGDDRLAGRFFPTYLAVFKCRPYVRLLMTYALHITAITFLSGTIAYYFKYIYKDEGMVTFALLALLGVAMIFIPVSVVAARKIGKKKAYQVFFWTIIAVCMVIFFFGHLFGPMFFLAMMVLAGVGLGFSYVAPYAMLPDAIEVDALRTGVKKEGSFYGMWTFMTKVGAAVALAASGLVLQLGGFEPNVDQGPGALLAIRLLIGPVAVVFFAAAYVALRKYPLTEEKYRAIMEGRE